MAWDCLSWLWRGKVGGVINTLMDIQVLKRNAGNILTSWESKSFSSQIFYTSFNSAVVLYRD